MIYGRLISAWFKTGLLTNTSFINDKHVHDYIILLPTVSTIKVQAFPFLASLGLAEPSLAALGQLVLMFPFSPHP